MSARNGSMLRVLLASGLITLVGCGVTGPTGPVDAGQTNDAGQDSGVVDAGDGGVADAGDGGVVDAGDGGSADAGDGGITCSSMFSSPTLALSSPTPTRAATATFTVSNCGDAAALLITQANVTQAPSMSDSGWQACTTEANALTAPLLGGLNVLRVWGKDKCGQVYDASNAQTISVVRNNMFSLGGSHSCALVQGGVWCWGDNEFGQSGNGSLNTTNPTPVQVTNLSSGVLEIAGASYASDTCALKSDGTVWCWGIDDTAELGNPSVATTCGMGSSAQTCALEPVEVEDSMGNPVTGVTAIAEGAGTTCALQQSGTVLCWGSNYYGQTDTGKVGNTVENPTAAVGLPSSGLSLAVGVATMCAFSPSGALCAGLDYTNNDTAVFGPQAAIIGAPGDEPVNPATNKSDCWSGSQCRVTPAGPVALNGLPAPDQMAVGFYHACAIVQGAVHCWGANQMGQYGNGSTAPDGSGAIAMLPGTADLITAGASDVCARVSGSVYCWGLNDLGELGSATMENCSGSMCSTVPVMVPGIGNVAAIAAGRNQTCAASDGHVYCWGGDMHGELGATASDNCPDSSMNPMSCSYSPLQVSGLGMP